MADEFNLADPAVMISLLPILEGRNNVEFPGINNEIRVSHGFRFFATQNDTSYANRYTLPVSLRNRFLEVQVVDFETFELIEIIKKKHDQLTTSKQIASLIDEDSLKNMANIYKTLRENNFNVTLREFIKWLRRKEKDTDSYHLIGYQLFSSRYANNKDVKVIFKSEYKKLNAESFDDIQMNITQSGSEIHFEESSLKMTLKDCDISYSKLFQGGKKPPQNFVNSLIRLAFAALNKEPIMLIGPSCYKSLLVRTWHEISKRKSKTNNLKIIHLTSDTESSDLIGRIIPCNFFDASKFLINLGRKLLARIEVLIKKSDSKPNEKSLNQLVTSIYKIFSNEETGNGLSEIFSQIKDLNNESTQNKENLNKIIQSSSIIKVDENELQSSDEILLEGPPGVGKTTVVNQLCQILGRSCERINFSGCTTVEQLFGSIVPQSINGNREFRWRDGIIVKAIKKRKWLLLDEVNLASAEVLQSLTPLLDRQSESFTVPGSDEEIREELKDVRIFATMNPVNIGGGRSKLPRSIENLFAIVKLEEYDSEELYMIIEDLFKNAISKHYLNKNHLKELYALHKEIKEKYSRREIGRHGGPYEFNLREISKFKDILENNAEDQIDHFKFMVDVSDELNTKFEDSDITTLSIRKFADLVYASQFHYLEDQKLVRDLIAKHFVLRSEYLKKSKSIITIDDSVFDTIRIGSIYMRKGTSSLINATNLIHSKETVKQLELIAAACQSKRAVLLEGETCSRKTALVQELANLTKNKLVIISLNQDTETSDLIGQWVPDQQKKSDYYNCINELFEEIVKLWLIFGFPNFAEKESLIISNKIIDAYQLKFKSDNSVEHSLKAIEQLKEAIDHLLGMLQTRSDSARDLIETFQNYYSRIEFYNTKLLDESKLEKGNNVSFVFVDSQFVKALKMGFWVLLDNVNSAPPEVIERINSLLEEKPTLNIYEYHDGEELSREKYTIHKEFRIFCTSNSHRESSNKLSSSFFNRVIRIWLPKIDDDVDAVENIQDHDIYELTHKLFSKLNFNNSIFSLVLTEFHKKFKMLLSKKEINLSEDDSNITFRRILKTINLVGCSFKNNQRAFDVLVHSTLDNYLEQLRSNEHKKLAFGELKNVLIKYTREVEVKNSSKEGNYLVQSPDEQSSEIIEHMLTLENLLVVLTFNCLKYADSTDKELFLSKVLLFASKILLPLNLKEPKELENFMKTIQSNSEINLIEELEKLSILKKYNFNFSNFNNQDLIDNIESLRILLLKYCEKSTLNDLSIRKAFIKKVLSVFEQFWNILTLNEDSIKNEALKQDLIKTMPYIEEILCFEYVLNIF